MAQHHPDIQHTLRGRVIAVPETRELDVLASMLERRGATVCRCPLVAILDAPDPEIVLEWIRSFAAGACDDLILLTGEGLRRMLSCISQHEPALHGPFVERLGQVRTLVRGPKPARVLRELGLRPDLEATTATTDGVIDTLRTLDLRGRRVGVQLYGTDPNTKLIEFLQAAGAEVATVAPYIYAGKSDDEAVLALLSRMARGEVDVLAFTSKSQVDRLFALVPHGQVLDALARTQVAAVGPVIREALAGRGINVRYMPTDSFFMKPLVRALELELGPAPK